MPNPWSQSRAARCCALHTATDEVVLQQRLSGGGPEAGSECVATSPVAGGSAGLGCQQCGAVPDFSQQRANAGPEVAIAAWSKLNPAPPRLHARERCARIGALRRLHQPHFKAAPHLNSKSQPCAAMTLQTSRWGKLKDIQNPGQILKGRAYQAESRFSFGVPKHTAAGP